MPLRASPETLGPDTTSRRPRLTQESQTPGPFAGTSRFWSPAPIDDAPGRGCLSGAFIGDISQNRFGVRQQQPRPPCSLPCVRPSYDWRHSNLFSILQTLAKFSRGACISAAMIEGISLTSRTYTISPFFRGMTILCPSRLFGLFFSRRH